jgi:hypothetical protein
MRNGKQQQNHPNQPTQPEKAGLGKQFDVKKRQGFGGTHSSFCRFSKRMYSSEALQPPPFRWTAVAILTVDSTVCCS